MSPVRLLPKLIVELLEARAGFQCNEIGACPPLRVRRIQHYQWQEAVLYYECLLDNWNHFDTAFIHDLTGQLEFDVM